MASYPIALDVRGRPVVVVGGGSVAERKIRALLEAAAAVTAIAPQALPALHSLAEQGALTLHERPFAEGDLDGALLAFAATGDPAVNARVVAEARSRGILVNDASDGERGDFATPGVHRSGSVTFAVDTAGVSPSFAARLRDELRETFDERYGRAAATLDKVREYAFAVVPPERRADVMRHFANRDLDELAALKPNAAENEIEAFLERLERAAEAPADFAQAICATRASPLALQQTRAAMAKLALSGIASTILHVTTTGDRVQDRSLAALGTDSIFVKELELALREGRADYAVHSCKDLPSTLADDMTLAAIGAREDPRDAFCSERYRSLEELPAGALVGTSSPRRRAQLEALRPDLRFEPIRGNVDTRLRKLAEGAYDAIVLAMAGLIRLGFHATHTVPLDPALVVPAVGQGALALECRAGDGALAGRLHAAFADAPTELAVRAERAFLRALRGGCQAPVGAFAVFDGETLALQAAICAPDGSQVVRGERRAALREAGDPECLGDGLARELLAAGGATLLARDDLPLAGRIFLLPRTQDRPSRIAPALRAAGADVVEAAGSEQAFAALAGRTPHVLLFPSSGSVAAIAGFLESLRQAAARPYVAAMGEASSAAARAAGFTPDFIAGEASLAAFVQGVTASILSGTAAPRA